MRLLHFTIALTTLAVSDLASWRRASAESSFAAFRCYVPPVPVPLDSLVRKWWNQSAVVVYGTALTDEVALNPSGTVTPITAHLPDSVGPIGARFLVLRRWKGNVPDTILVAWRPSKNIAVSEVFGLAAGRTYVLFLPNPNPFYWSGGCGGSSVVPRADTIAALLDSLRL